MSMVYCPIPDTVVLNNSTGTVPYTTVDELPDPPTETPAPSYPCSISGDSITTNTAGGSTSTSVTTTVPGPSGPPGPQGPEGPPGTTLELYDGDELLGEISKLKVSGGLVATIDEDAGTIAGAGAGALVWGGEWGSGLGYEVNEVVLYNPPVPEPPSVFFGLLSGAPNPLPGTGDAFVCIEAHTSSDEVTPTDESKWQPLTRIGNGPFQPKDRTLLDKINGVFDWMKNASIGDWLKVAAIAGGIIWAGDKILDALTDTGSGQASSKFNGTNTYSGSYTQPSLRDFVASLCALCLEEDQYDVSLLSDTQRVSLTLQQVPVVGSLIDQLSQLFLFDADDSGGVLKFVPRNSASVRVLTYNDMAFTSTNELISPVTYKRLQGNDLPRKVSLTYVAADLNYSTYTQITEIPSFTAGQEISISVPFVLDHTLAKELSEQILINAHLERQTYTFRTSYVNAVDLEPGDVITIPDGNVRILTMEEVEDGLIEFVTCMAGFTGAPQPIMSGDVVIGYTASSFLTSGQPAQIPAVPATVAKTKIGFSQAFFIDPPVLDSSDTTPRMFAAVHGYGAAGWPGAQIFRSVDGGSSYTLIAQTSSAATLGIVSGGAVVPEADHHVIDDETTITVQLVSGSLSSINDAALFNGGNLCMVGRECLQFGVATLVGPKTYELTHLLRGRQGTEYAISTHEENELFVMLDDSLVEIEATESERGKPYLYKTITIGSDLSKVEAEEVQILGQNTIPWTIANPAISVHTDGSFVMQWVERPRFVNSLVDTSDVTKDLDFGGYCVAVYEDIEDEDPVRTVFVYEPIYVYSVADQITDFGSQQSNLAVKIFQVSNKYGGGQPTIVTI